MGFKVAVLVFLGPICSVVNGETIEVSPLTQVPLVDGFTGDWKGVPVTIIPLRPNTPDTLVEAKEVRLQAGYFGDTVYFHLQWLDSEENRVHKSYVWDAKKKRYVRGPQREDRLAMQFAMEGEYTSNWFAADDFKADMWHWKSARTDPLGIAHDKMTIISRTQMLRAAQIERPEGGFTYILRPADGGEQPYSTKRYRNFKEPVMPKYQLNPGVSGSVADVKAKGRWANGFWHLELARKLDTGNADDAVFRIGASLAGAISVFDASETDDHVISDTLNFQF